MVNEDLDRDDDVFGEELPEEEEVEQEVATKEPEKEEDEKGVDTEEELEEEVEEQSEAETEEEEEVEAESPSEEEKHDDEEETHIPVGALKKERLRRQASERELNDTRRKLAEYEGDDLSEEQRQKKEQTDARITASREIIVDFKEDYEDMENIFMDLNDDDPYLGVKMRNSKNPAKFVYDTAKKHLKSQEVTKTLDSDEWKEFQEFKNGGKKSKQVDETPQQKRKKAALSTPNINKAASAKSSPSDNTDDGLWD